jgi:hypothetical protein
VELRPLGILELSLVEKIAISLWRQRRLVCAETATLELRGKLIQIADEVTSSIGMLGFGKDKVEPEDLLPLDQSELDQLDWCRSVIAQYDAGGALEVDNLSKVAP